MNESNIEEIAIIGMAGSFPGANNIHELWKKLLQQKESISTLSESDLEMAGVDASIYKAPNYVPRRGFLDNAEYFDNDFFKMSPLESEITDPQHLVILEQSWLSLEDAGYIPGEIELPVGVFVGSSVNRYVEQKHAWKRPLNASDYQVMLANEKDYLATRISYKLNLKGPSVNVQSACSTSLLAVGTACKSLLNYECDMALAGGVTVTAPRKTGYTYREGMIHSKTGKCRPFDSSADGTIASEGVGVVCLKRLSEAIQDKDHIYAVIKSVGINNDGNDKIGFTAPSINGQADVIGLAQALADVTPSDIGFLETHGTGTLLGDSVEFAALKEVFRDRLVTEPRCYLGTLKANLGHLDAAAGVAGLIKTVFVVKTGIIPGAINFETPNPDLGLDTSPFAITKENIQWPSNGKRRVAGISSFGMGGTNVHAIIEAPPQINNRNVDRKTFVFTSAKTPDALIEYKNNLKEFIIQNEDIALTDIAWTLRHCRRFFQYRWGCSAESKTELIKKLDEKTAFPRLENDRKKVVFLFPGQGAQFSGMAARLYGSAPVFTKWVDRGISLAQPFFEEPLSDFLLQEGHDDKVKETRIAQPLLFIIEYALAMELHGANIKPDALCGHSLGEYVAACLAGVSSFEEALKIVIKRADWMTKAPEGAMLAVATSEEELRNLITDDVKISGYNSIIQQVVAGSPKAIEAFERVLKGKGVRCSKLKTSHAFHSSSMEEILTGFSIDLDEFKFEPPSIPMVSNITGDWMPTDNNWHEYWLNQTRNPVRFSDCLNTLLKNETIFIEVGPGAALRTFVRSNDKDRLSVVLSTLSNQNSADQYNLENTLVSMWQYGYPVDWENWDHSNGRRVPLPGYPFEKKPFWIIERGKRHVDARALDEDRQTNTDESLSKLSSLEMITRAWKDCFGIDEIRTDQDFFSLGGDSLMGVELVETINERLNLNLTFGELVRHPTLKELAEHIELPGEVDSPECNFPLLFPVQPKGTKPPFFLVAGAHGNRYFDVQNMKSSYEEDFLSYFSMIVRELGMEQPIYGFRPKGLLLHEKPYPSVEVMAMHNIREMKKVQPQGPYFIGGECVGGLVAYEMAAQLQKTGDKVAQLILMDTYKPTFMVQIKEEYDYFKGKIKDGVKDFLKYITSSKRRHWKKDALRWLPLWLSVVLPITENQWMKRRVLLGSYQYFHLLLSYRPKAYDGRVTFIVNQYWHKKHPLLGWGSELGVGTTVEVVPGSHSERIRVYGHVSGKILKNTIKSD